MRIGTKSVLYGAHQFLIHPVFLFIAWWKLYGFPWDPRLWVAFVVHDLGYFGKPNMDGDEGELHPYWGAYVMGALFGRRWFTFCLYHSRYLAKEHGQRPSALCMADKMAIALEPWWVYLPRVIATGEIREYMDKARHGSGGKYVSGLIDTETRRGWHASMTGYLRDYVAEHLDGREDSWTPSRVESEG